MRSDLSTSSGGRAMESADRAIWQASAKSISRTAEPSPAFRLLTWELVVEHAPSPPCTLPPATVLA